MENLALRKGSSQKGKWPGLLNGSLVQTAFSTRSNSIEGAMTLPASTVHPTPRLGDTIALITPQERLIQRLLWTSIQLSVSIFGCSMARLGWGSLFLSPCVTALCVAYDITLLVLTAKERKRTATQEIHGHPSSVHQTVGPSSRPPLPSVCRKPSIILPFVFALLWLAAIAANITILALLSHSAGPRMAPSIIEVMFIAFHIAVLVKLGALCMKERRRLMGEDRHAQLKWYQLGQYE